MRKILTASVIAMILLASPTKGAEPNWNRIAFNTFLWGQLAGCLIRFQEYSRYVDEKVTDQQIDSAIRAYVGDVDGLLNKLFQANRTAFPKQHEKPEKVRALIARVAEREVNQGVAWLQALGCVAALRDNGLIK